MSGTASFLTLDPGFFEDRLESAEREAARLSLALLPFPERRCTNLPCFGGIVLAEIEFFPSGFEASPDFGVFWRHDGVMV